MKLKKMVMALLLCTALFSSASLAGCNRENGSISSDYGNTSGNISNLGGAAEHKNMLYYQNGEDNFSIYTADMDGGNPVKLNDCQSYFINVLDDYIVYANADDEYHIYKMKLDGSENTKLNDAQSYYVHTAGDKIVYSNWSDGNKIYTMELDGSENKSISDDQAYYVSVSDNKIYYSNWSDGAKLYSVDIDGNNKLKLADTGCWYVVPDDEWVYYSQWEKLDEQEETNDDKYLCRVKKDGSVKEVLNEVPCGDINVYNDRVYFTNWTENNIYSMNKDGSDIKKLSDDYGVYLNLAGNKLFYVKYDENRNVELKNMDIKGEN